VTLQARIFAAFWSMGINACKSATYGEPGRGHAGNQVGDAWGARLATCGSPSFTWRYLYKYIKIKIKIVKIKIKITTILLKNYETYRTLSLLEQVQLQINT
jgi:hypothetical protein